MHSTYTPLQSLSWSGPHTYFFHGGTPVGIKSIARLVRIISDAGSCGNHCGKSVCAGRLVTVKRRLALTFHPWTTFHCLL